VIGISDVATSFCARSRLCVMKYEIGNILLTDQILEITSNVFVIVGHIVLKLFTVSASHLFVAIIYKTNMS
jgi:hypothetical protein